MTQRSCDDVPECDDGRCYCHVRRQCDHLSPTVTDPYTRLLDDLPELPAGAGTSYAASVDEDYYAAEVPVPKQRMRRFDTKQEVRLPTEARERKKLPITTGVLDYFPDALIEVARCSQVGNDQHNPGQPLHWAKEKSTDEADALVRHLLERGTFDTDGVRHSAKVAWRALALLQREIESEQ